MTVIASSSYTISIVNDGEAGKNAYEHVAYSWSGDGKDRFTTVYPNINQWKNTKEQSYISTGTGANNSKSFYTIDGEKSNVLNKTLRVTYDYVITDSTGTWSGVIRPTYGFGGTEQAVSSSSLTGSHAETITVTSISYDAFSIYTKGLPAGTKVTISNLKVELGSVGTVWLPSSSEITTNDYPKYRGYYFDNAEYASTDYTKYTWVLFRGTNGDNVYTHKAWAYNSTGTDRFTTVYPTANLLAGTATHDKFVGTGSTNGSGSINYYLDGGKKISDLGLTSYQELIVEYDWKATGSGFAGTFTYQSTPATYFKGTAVTLSSTNTSGHSKNTFYNMPVTTDTSTGMIIRQDNIPTTVTVEIYNVMMYIIDYSPWTPAKSESTYLDYPSHMGTYSDNLTTQSTDPTYYEWAEDINFIQGGLQSTLDTKANQDDLDNTTELANNALDTANNAVTSEEYNAWRDGEYSNTQAKVNEIISENQADILAIENRTTIVEGNFNNMKVKWNFIDESFSFGEEGMFISNTGSKMSIQITSDKIVFWDNGVDVAFINGQMLNIQKGIFTESAVIGNHQITKYSDESPVTIIRYIG